MALDKTTAAEDLAFLRTLVTPDDGGAYQRGFGFIYALWGLAFGLPLFVQWLASVGVFTLPGWYWAAAASVATLVLTVVSVVAGRRSKPVVGVQARAMNAVFGGIGLANVAVLVALIFAANVLKDGRVLMLHAVVVFAFQGAAWFTVWALRKRPWHGLVAVCWLVLAAALGATMPGPNFLLLCTLGLILLMAVPGWIMMRTAPKA